MPGLRKFVLILITAGFVSLPGSAAAAGDVTGLTVRNVAAAQYVPGTDNRNHIEYDLMITNGMQTAASTDLTQMFPGPP